MDDKLEELAKSRRRLISSDPNREWEDPDAMYKFMEKIEAEDRKNSDFPYDNVQRIKDYYANKGILITGVTGLVGKVLLEKILRSMPEGGPVFLLIRSRKGVSAQKRMEELLELPLFSLVMKGNPEAAKRITAVEGDCGSVGLGLSPADRQTIIDNVSIVFHCAANIRFSLNTANMILVNVRGTREVVSLCKDLKKLDVFLYVSTAYSNATADRTKPIPEAVVRSDVDWRTVVAMAENPSDECALELLFKKIAPYHPVTYTFSKVLAENLVEDECKGLPAVIVRPSVVIPSYEDPFGGWVDNMHGPMSIWDGISQGVLRVHYADANLVLDYVPVDWSVKVLIATAWHRGLGFRMRSDPEQVDVVNNCPSSLAKHTFAMYDSKKQLLYDRNSHRYILRYPRFLLTERFWLFWLITIFSQLPMGLLVDTLLRLKGKKPMLLRIYRKIYVTQKDYLSMFCTKPFSYEDSWQWLVQSRMPKEDRDRFSGITKLLSMGYYYDAIGGIIKYGFKEKGYTREESNRQIMYILDWVHNAILLGIGIWILRWMFFDPASSISSVASVHDL